MGQLVPLTNIEDDVREDSDGEQDRKARPIKHSYIRDIKDEGVLEVDYEIRSRVQIHILIDLRLFSLVKSLFRIFFPALVDTLLKPFDYNRCAFNENGHECVNSHGLNYLITNDRVPFRLIVIERSL